MGCFGRSSHVKKNHTFQTNSPKPEPPKPKEELLLQISECTLHLIEGGDTIELTRGDFTLVRLVDGNASLAFILKVGNDIQWPLTKDEPVMKLSKLNYLFSLPMKDGHLLSYGLSFSEQSSNNLGSLDTFLKEHSCFTVASSTVLAPNAALNWKEYAPRIEDYNGVLAKAIAAGTGGIVKGIFMCSNAYSNQVQKGGEMITSPSKKEKSATTFRQQSDINRNPNGTKKSGTNKGLKRVRKLSKMTEKMSKSLLNGVGIVSGSIVTPLVRSSTGKALLANVPGEVLLASLDAVNKVLDAAEAAEKQALSATSKATSRMVSNRFGESAGEATEDAFATAGHCAGTAWNIFKIRKAINPASSLRSAAVKSAIKNR